MSVQEILHKYSNGEIGLEAANQALAEADAGFYLDPKKNLLSQDEIVNGTAGLLDTGTGSFDKVEIVNGELKYPVNIVMPDGKPSMKALVLAQGKTFEVYGTKLIEV